MIRKVNVVIYHAPNFVNKRNHRKGKVGCTQDFNKRKLDCEMGKGVKILESLTDVTLKQAGDREWWWADKLGCPRDRRYETAVLNRLRASSSGGRASVISGHQLRAARMGGKANALYGNTRNGGIAAGKIIRKCLKCGRIGNGNAMFIHKKRCGGNLIKVQRYSK